MALRSAGRKLSFEILRHTSSPEDDQPLPIHSYSDPIQNNHAQPHSQPSAPNRKRRKHKASKRKKISELSIPEDQIAEEKIVHPISVSASSRDPHSNSENRKVFIENRETCYANGYDLDSKSYCTNGTLVCEEITSPQESKESVCVLGGVTETEFQSVRSGDGFNFGELRQRPVNGGCSVEDSAASMSDDNGKDDSGINSSPNEKQRNEPNANVVAKLEKAESLDWERLMAEDPNYKFSVEKSPVKYFLDEMYNGNSLRSTTTVGNEKERERVYDTIFRLPWRCELLISVGFFVCFDSFLSLLTVMPTRIVMTIWRILKTSSRSHQQ